MRSRKPGRLIDLDNDRTLDEMQKLAATLQNPQGPMLLDCKINASVAAAFLLETVEHERHKG